MSLLLVAVGAAVGAPLRYLMDRTVQARHRSRFPWGTLTVNVTGCFVLGLVTGGAAAGAVPAGVATLLGPGLCGALTTYSTFGYETVRLAAERAPLLAVANAAGSIAAGLGAAALGVVAAGAIWA